MVQLYIFFSVIKGCFISVSSLSFGPFLSSIGETGGSMDEEEV